MNLRNRLPFFLAYAQKPRKPTFLEYVEFDGKSYIDTGYYPNEQTYAEYTFEVYGASNYQGLFGSRKDQTAEGYVFDVFIRNANYLRIDWGAHIGNEFTSYSLNTKYTMKAGLGEVYLDDTLVKTYTVLATGTSPYSIYLGNINDAGKPYTSGSLQKVYGFKAYENNALLQDLRPALDPRGVVCFYDTVSGQYFYNQGTGELKAGGRFVESILLDGASFIDTGMSHQTCVVECTIKFTETGARQLMGFGSSTAQYWGKPANSVILEGVSGTNVTDKTDVVLNVNTDEEGVVKITRSADGKTVVGSTGKTISTMNYAIGALPFTPTTQGYYCTCEVWAHKFYIGGELVQDLRPYVDGDGVVCFKDVVTGALFYNQGTGTLGYTEYEPQEFIYLNGSQYIDTGLLHETCTIETAVKYEAGHSRRMLTGWSGSGSYWGMTTNKTFEVNGKGVSGTNLTDYTVVMVALDNENLTITGTADGKTEEAAAVYAKDTYTIGCSSITSVNKVIGNVYYMKARNANGVLVRDMIPVKRSDGVVCMYDRVENKYYELINK